MSSRAKEHHEQTFQQDWQSRQGLIHNVDSADVKGFPPARWPRRGLDHGSLGIATLLGADPSMFGLSAFELLNAQSGGKLDNFDKPVAKPKPKRSPRLRILLEALEAAPWKQEAAPSQQPRPNVTRKAAKRPSLTGRVAQRPSTAHPGAKHTPAEPSSQRPFSAPTRPNAGSLQILSLLSSCESEIDALLKNRSPKQPFKDLCCALLLVVSEPGELLISWEDFRAWARRFEGAAGFMQSLKSFDSRAVSVVVAERTVQFMIKHKIFPELFHLGSRYYDKHCIPKFAPPFCRWVWNVCKIALGSFGTSRPTQIMILSLIHI